MNDCTIILFGASGDLAKRKIIPSLYRMIQRGVLKKFLLIGAALDSFSADDMLQQARQFIPDIDPKIWKKLQESSFYHSLNFTHPQDYIALQQYVLEQEEKHSMSGNRILYLAVASSFFCEITRQIAICRLAQKLNTQESYWHRIVYEKPFGHDLASAKEIDACIEKSFFENQIYRIDHFLTKELVSNIALIRFTNIIFEPLWNNKYIDSVHIILDENIGIEGRGLYYDHYGALADVVQNHMLEMLALIAMESPQQLTGESVSKERAKVLSEIRFVDGILGQYEGYKKEKGVKEDSATETFAALSLAIDNERWKGVPFYLKTGKRLAHKQTAIHIVFKQVTCLLTKECPSPANSLTIQISPEQFFALHLNAKKIGVMTEVTPIKMEFCHSCAYGNNNPTAYEKLFEDVMQGEQSIAVRTDEIEYAWKVIDTIKSSNLPLYTYKQGSEGPKELEAFTQKYTKGFKK